MTTSNKKDLKHFGKVAAALTAGLVDIATHCAVWNGVTAGTIDGFLGWVAAVDFFFLTYCGYRFFKDWLLKDIDSTVK